jgi:hypothetical protein
MVTELLGRLSDAFSENIQPFFIHTTFARKMVLAIGEYSIHYPAPHFSFQFSWSISNHSFIRISLIETTWFCYNLVNSMVLGQYAASSMEIAGLIRHTLGAVVYMRR